MSSPAYRTFFGKRVWPSPILKLYFPFFISGTTIFFLFSNVHTKLMDAPDDKWVRIVDNVTESSAKQALKAEAEEYLKNHK